MKDGALKLGITPWQLHSELDADTLCRQAELAESWGYDAFWLPESHFAGAHTIPEPMMLLAAVAARTVRIKLATSSYLLPIRNPLQAAEQVAQLDRLSQGRVILGLGRGFQTSMLDAFEVASKDKRQIFASVLNTMRRAWAGEPMGKADNPAYLSPLPVQQPHPPLWVAAFGPKALAQAAGLNLPYLASPMENLISLEHNQQVYLTALQAAGHSQPTEIPIMRTVFIHEDPTLTKSIKARLQEASSHPEVPPANGSEPAAIVGNAEQVQQEVNLYRERLGMTYLVAVRPRLSGLSKADCEASAQALAQLFPGNPAQ